MMAKLKSIGILVLVILLLVGLTVEVYAAPSLITNPTLTTCTNLVNDDPTAAMLSQSGLGAFTTSNCVDNDTATQAFYTDDSVAGSWLKVDNGAGNEKAYGKVRLYVATAGIANWKIQYSDDNLTWTDAATNLTLSPAGWHEKTWDYCGAHRYWRLYLTNTPGGGPWYLETEWYSYQVADGWSNNTGPGHTATFEIDGGQKIAVTASAAATNSNILQYYSPVTAGEVISTQVKAKISTSVNFKASLDVVFIDASGGYISDTLVDLTQANPDYTLLKAENITAPANAKQVRIVLYAFTLAGGATGTAWFKDVVLEKQANKDVNPSKIGIESFWNFISDDLGAGWGYAINTFNGNLIIQKEFGSVPGLGIDLSEGIVYNHQSAQTGNLGWGWKLQSDQSLKENADGSVTFKDEDGTSHKFTKNEDGAYKAPDGIFLNLTKLDPTTFTIKGKANSIFRYENGLLKSVTDKRGNATSFSYDANNRIKSMTDPSGCKSTYRYTPEGRLDKITDPINKTVSFSYYSDGKLFSVTDQKGNLTYFFYDSQNRINKITDANAHSTSIFYDATGKVSKVKDARSTETKEYATTLSYDTALLKTTVTTPSRRSITYTHNSCGNLIHREKGRSGCVKNSLKYLPLPPLSSPLLSLLKPG